MGPGNFRYVIDFKALCPLHEVFIPYSAHRAFSYPLRLHHLNFRLKYQFVHCAAQVCCSAIPERIPEHRYPFPVRPSPFVILTQSHHFTAIDYRTISHKCACHAQEPIELQPMGGHGNDGHYVPHSQPPHLAPQQPIHVGRDPYQQPDLPNGLPHSHMVRQSHQLHTPALDTLIVEQCNFHSTYRKGPGGRMMHWGCDTSGSGPGVQDL